MEANNNSSLTKPAYAHMCIHYIYVYCMQHLIKQRMHKKKMQCNVFQFQIPRELLWKDCKFYCMPFMSVTDTKTHLHTHTGPQPHARLPSRCWHIQSMCATLASLCMESFGRCAAISKHATTVKFGNEL